MSELLQCIKMGLSGLLLGYVLSRIGFADFGQVTRMFSFADLRLLFTFGGAVALTMVGLKVLARAQDLTDQGFHRGIVGGSLLFGAGWALTGACPAIALVQLGQGYVPAVASLVGMLMGIWVYRPVHSRFFRWPASTCGD